MSTSPSTDPPDDKSTGMPANPRQVSRTAVRGNILDFYDDPLDNISEPNCHQQSGPVRFAANGWLLIEDGRIADVQTAHWQAPENWQVLDYRDHLVCPGFIDTHVHSGQTDVTASYGTTLLQWLAQYTFPNEARYADPQFADADAQEFCDALLGNGTTTAAVFPTVHPESVNALFAAAAARGMCMVTGKVLMDRHAPDYLLDAIDHGEAESHQLIRRWHQQGRLHYAVTPRFAPTSTGEQLALAGRLLKEYDGLYMQTHVAENTEELIGRVRQNLQRCRSLGITISMKKFEFGAEIDFEQSPCTPHS